MSVIFANHFDLRVGDLAIEAIGRPNENQLLLFWYVAIAHPMRNIWLGSIGRAKKVIAVIWVMSALFAIPTAIRIDYNFNDSLLGDRVYWCAREFPEFFGPSRKILNKIYAVYQMMLLIVFPVVTMTICYARVSIIVYSSSRDHRLASAVVAFSKAATDAMTFTTYTTLPLANAVSYRKAAGGMRTIRKTNSRIAETNKKQIVQMLISIVVMYTICWTPSIVDELLTSFGYICRPSNTPTLKYMRMGFHALAYCQSCINPICYAFISQNFRTTFKTAYTRMRIRGQAPKSYRSLSRLSAIASS
ncbi:Cholecystokinin receptor [Toxocara canis]|uniref:Cholecystokinin receptor n=1 Tax=Toxocara canis TaxID=6265 RepID=A0A0B2VV76_TOXCA|nr:Cholecystokinin receptor [Toxocara canis]